MLPRLIRKAEEREKQERAHHKRPAIHLEEENSEGVVLPNGCWDLVHHGVVFVREGPASPTTDAKDCGFHYPNRSQRNGPKYKGHRNDHQTDVPVTSETGRRHRLPQSTVVLAKEGNVHDCDK